MDEHPAPDSSPVPQLRFARIEIEQKPSARTSTRVEARGGGLDVKGTIEIPNKYFGAITTAFGILLGITGGRYFDRPADSPPVSSCALRDNIDVDKLASLLDRLREREVARAKEQAANDARTKEQAHANDEAHAKEIASLRSAMQSVAFTCKKELSAQRERLNNIEVAAAQKAQDDRLDALIATYQRDPQSLTKEALQKALLPASGALKVKTSTSE